MALRRVRPAGRGRSAPAEAATDHPHDPAALLERAAAGGPAAGVGSASRARGARGASGAGGGRGAAARRCLRLPGGELGLLLAGTLGGCLLAGAAAPLGELLLADPADRKSTRLNSSHVAISYAVFCLKKK